MSRVVVITGASAGIGAATATLLSRQGMSLGLMARRADRLAEVAGACGPDTLAITGDATSRADVAQRSEEHTSEPSHT